VKTLLIMGLPGAGKTTFLAALWHVVRLGTVPGAMQLVMLPTSRTYLNQIGGAWESCTEQGHTHAGAEVTVSLALADPVSNAQIEIAFPDLSGESFDSQWSHRLWSELYDDLAKGADGVILFVHADQSQTALCIGDEAGLADLLGDEGATEGDAVAQETSHPTAPPEKGPDGNSEAEPAQALKPYEDSFAPRQVKLVECLQFLLTGPLYHPSFPLSVVITAWDRVQAAGIAITPETWLDQHAPLLSQFLKANAEVLQPQIYGISATGGDLTSERDRLLDEAEPWQRIKVVEGNGRAATNVHDITLPIRRLVQASPQQQ
jgi:hypothetical protein